MKAALIPGRRGRDSEKHFKVSVNLLLPLSLARAARLIRGMPPLKSKRRDGRPRSRCDAPQISSARSVRRLSRAHAGPTPADAPARTCAPRLGLSHRPSTSTSREYKRERKRERENERKKCNHALMEKVAGPMIARLFIYPALFYVARLMCRAFASRAGGKRPVLFSILMGASSSFDFQSRRRGVNHAGLTSSSLSLSPSRARVRRYHSPRPRKKFSRAVARRRLAFQTRAAPRNRQSISDGRSRNSTNDLSRAPSARKGREGETILSKI